MRNDTSPRRNFDPEDLDLDAAMRLVFPGFNPDEGPFPRREWTVGDRPEYKIDNYQNESIKLLDDFISEAINLRDNNKLRGTRLLPSCALSSRGIACPYFYARLGIAYAVKQASSAKIENARMTTIRAKEQEYLHGLASEAKSSIEALTREYSPNKISSLILPKGRFGHQVDKNLFYDVSVSVKNRYADLTKAWGALADIMADLSEERGRHVKTGVPDVWVASFITAIGYLWTTLTGKQPTKGGRFAEFLSASYTIVGGDSDISGVRRIETSIKARPEEFLQDKNYSLVPETLLLMYEIAVNRDINPDYASAIKRMIEGEDKSPGLTLQAICESGNLPAPIYALVERLPWSLSELKLDPLGKRLNIIESDLSDLLSD